ncbi:MAG: desulfoferrodoxin [Lentisphaerae bacterium]|nr:desulfoferrodoxin [Lentisphaerota bacterium]
MAKAIMSGIYKCSVCGNMVEMIHVGGGELVCCGKPMNLLDANSTDAATEKHVPVIKKTRNGVRVSVGSVLHPMEANHYIEWIEVEASGAILRQMLKPGDKPVAEFKISGDLVTAREYCNVHGLWKNA